MNKLTKIEKELIAEYKRNFFEKTGKKISFIQLENHWVNICKLNNRYPSATILMLIAEATGWNMTYVLENKNKKIHNVHKRQVVYYILFNNGYNMCQIGRMFDKDHTTILHSLRSFEFELENDPYIGKLLTEIMTDINETCELVGLV